MVTPMNKLADGSHLDNAGTIKVHSLNYLPMEKDPAARANGPARERRVRMPARNARRLGPFIRRPAPNAVAVILGEGRSIVKNWQD